MGSNPASKPGHPDDRWMVSFSAYPRESLGVRSLFNRHFVKAGTVPRDLARLYNDLFDNRQQGDYVGFVVFEEEQVRPWIMQAEELVRHIERLLSIREQAPDT